MTKIKKISLWVFSIILLAALALFCVFQGKNNVITVSAAESETEFVATRVDNAELESHGYILHNESVSTSNVAIFVPTGIDMGMTESGRMWYAPTNDGETFGFNILVNLSQTYDINRVLAVDFEHIFANEVGRYGSMPSDDVTEYYLLLGNEVVGRFDTGFDHYNVDSSSCLPTWIDGKTSFDTIKIVHSGQRMDGCKYLFSSNFEVFYTENAGDAVTGWETMSVSVRYMEVVDNVAVYKQEWTRMPVGQNFLESDFYKNLPTYEHVEIVGVEQEDTVCTYWNMNFSIKYEWEKVELSFAYDTDTWTDLKVSYYENLLENSRLKKWYGKKIENIKYFSTVQNFTKGTWSDEFREKVNENTFVSVMQMLDCSVKAEYGLGRYYVYPVYNYQLLKSDPDYVEKSPDLVDNFVDGLRDVGNGVEDVFGGIKDVLSFSFRNAGIIFWIIIGGLGLGLFVWLFMLIYRPLKRLWGVYKETDKYKERKMKRDERKRKRKEKRKRKKDERKKR